MVKIAIFSIYNVQRVVTPKIDFVCVDVLRPSQPNGVIWSAVSLLAALLLARLSPLSGLPVLCTFFRQKQSIAILESTEGRELP